eukprot:UN04839
MADVGVLVVQANKQEFEKSIKKDNGLTRVHAQLLYILGYRQIIVCVNFDSTSTEWRSSKNQLKLANNLDWFLLVKDRMEKLLVNTGFKKQSFQIIPVDAYHNINITSDDEQHKIRDAKPEAHHLTYLLDKWVVPRKLKLKNEPFRFSIWCRYKISGVGDVFVGKVEQGTLKANQGGFYFR